MVIVSVLALTLVFIIMTLTIVIVVTISVLGITRVVVGRRIPGCFIVVLGVEGLHQYRQWRMTWKRTIWA